MGNCTVMVPSRILKKALLSIFLFIVFLDRQFREKKKDKFQNQVCQYLS